MCKSFLSVQEGIGVSPPSLMQQAIQMAEQGMMIFPLHPNGKRPLTCNGFKDASHSSEQVEQWWEQSPAANIGLPTGTGNGIVVVDVDVKDGKAGKESLRALQKGCGAFQTLAIQTPTGGYHFYFSSHDPEIGNRTAMRNGIDIRGNGGYVVAPSSVIDGNAYRVIVDEEIAPLPVSLSEEIKGVVVDQSIKQSSYPDLVTALNGVGAGQRNDCLFKLAARYRGKGLDYQEAKTLVCEAAANCTPPMEEGEALQCLRSAYGRYQAGDQWQSPQSFTESVEPLLYPLDALPTIIRNAVEEVQQFTKAPLVMVASSALGALSMVGQAHIDIKRSSRLKGPSSLFVMTIADSGERKSTVDGLFVQPIIEYEQQQAEAAKPDLDAYRADVGLWESKRKGLLLKVQQNSKSGKSSPELEHQLTVLESTKPEHPRIPKILMGDETPENLAWTLAKQWPSGAVTSSEAGIVLGAHGMNSDSIMRNLSQLNVLWDGGKLSIGRRTSESFEVTGVRLTVALQVQEPTLRAFFEKSGALARGTGFLARFLIAWPQSTMGTRFYEEPPDHCPALTAFNQRMREVLNQSPPMDEAGRLEPILLSLSPEAKELWVRFHDRVEAELTEGGEFELIRDVAAKAADNAARLAALFQLIESEISQVSAENFESSSQIVSWHLNESRRFFGELVLPAVIADAVKLQDWLLAYCKRDGCSVVPRRVVQQSGPNRLRNGKVLDAALDELVELQRVRLIKEGSRVEVHLNPALLKKWEG